MFAVRCIPMIRVAQQISPSRLCRIKKNLEPYWPTSFNIPEKQPSVKNVFVQGTCWKNMDTLHYLQKSFPYI